MLPEKKLKIAVWINIIILFTWIIVLFLDIYYSRSIWWKIFAMAFIVIQSALVSKSIITLDKYNDREC